MSNLKEAIESHKQYLLKLLSFIETLLKNMAKDKAVSSTLETDIENAIRGYIEEEYRFCKKITEVYRYQKRSKDYLALWKHTDAVLKEELDALYKDLAEKVKDFYSRLTKEQIRFSAFQEFLRLADEIFMHGIAPRLEEYKRIVKEKRDCEHRQFSHALLLRALARVIHGPKKEIN